MSKIAISSNTLPTEENLRRDMGRIRDVINQMQTVDTGWTTPTNLTTVKTFDADSTSVAELADVVGTLIAQLKSAGIIGG